MNSLNQDQDHSRIPSLFDRQPQGLDTIREEPRESRFDLSQTIQELMGNAGSKGFASFFNNQNSNDSTSNGAMDNSSEYEIRAPRY